jgi:Tol biopolymer transport system component/tRNA A-37 threonylcarbamoyl transferase component Bud32
MQPGPKPPSNQGDSSARSPEESGEKTSGEAEPPSGSAGGSAAEEAPRRPIPRSSSSALRPGERIGAYRVERRLGRGGMGEVYLAFDDRLGRLVAIKRIRHDGPLSEVQRQRFRREARAAARLNHPAIVQIFDLVTAGDSGDSGDSSSAGGSDALVMEYVNGESLADMVARGPLDPAVAVRFAREIALGLAAAHAASFVHRDLKSENVMVTASGAVKILDFGLVKSVWSEESPSAEQSLTAEGLVLGTFHTISPEQVRGAEADARSDLFSLGVLLYELLSGESPFRGGGHVESLRRIVTHHPPPLSTICPSLPRELSALVERLLEKDPRRRPQSARDVAAALGEIAALPGIGGPGGGGGFESAAEHTLSDRPTFPGAALVAAPAIGDTPGRSPGRYGEAKVMQAEAERSGAGGAGRVSGDPAGRSSAAALAPPRPSSSRPAEGDAGTGAPPVSLTSKLPLRLAAAALVVAAALGVYLVLRTGPGKAPSAPAQAPVRATFTQLTDFAGSESSPSISPDGSFFLYSKPSGGKSRIYLQRVGGTNSIDLSRDSPASDTQPAFSADGQQIAFRSERDGGGIFLMGAMGESVRRLTDFGFNPAWSPDGSEVACATAEMADPAIVHSSGQLWRVNVATGAKRRVVEGDSLLQPSWSPHGRRIAYCRVTSNARRALYTVPADRSAPVGAGEAVPVVDDQYLNWSPAWAPDGKHLYFASDRGGSMNLWRVAIDETTGKALGEPAALTTPSRWSGLPSIAKDGRRIAYETRDSKSSLDKIALDPVATRTVGPLQVLLQSSRYVRSCEVSPDGHWIAFHSQVPQEDLFIVRSDGSNLRQLTNDSYKDRCPVWSPDGSRIAFFSDRTGLYELWTILPDGGGLERVMPAQGRPMVYPIWSPDGRQLAGTLLDHHGTALIDLARPRSERVAAKVPVAGGQGDFSATAWSPDGRWLSGEFLPPGETTAQGIALYSFASHFCSRLTERGHNPHWLHDSRKLVYLDEGKLFWVDSRTRRTQLMLEPPANSSFFWVSVDPTDRLLYLVRQSDEGHIWMLTLG